MKSKGYSESEPPKENRNSGPILTKGIGTRISACAKAVGGKRKLADLVGIHETQLYRYINEENQPSIEIAASIAAAAEANMTWLTTGDGSMHDQVREGRANYEVSALDLELLQDVLEGVESSLEEAKRYLPPDKRGELILNIYEIFRESGAKPDRERILRLVKSVA